jgi:ectoine hydroxylase-related dioxygenase (phytanoyl-CoA dioxygenase family)
MQLDELSLARFRRDGFLNVGAVFSPTEVEEIGRTYDTLVRPDGQLLGNESDGQFPYRAMMNFRSEALAGYVTHPELLEIAEQVLGSDIRFWWDQGINKAPGAGSFIAWHQDNGYTQGRVAEYLTCWLALDDSDTENGGLLVIPGSHAGGQHKHEWQGVHAVISDVDESKAVPLDARAGDMLIFSSLLVHQTVGNTTHDRSRRAWVVQYCRGDQRNSVTGEVYDNRPWVVRGGEFQTKLEAERQFDLRGDRP